MRLIGALGCVVFITMFSIIGTVCERWDTAALMLPLAAGYLRVAYKN